MLVKSRSLTAAAAPVVTADEPAGYDPINLLTLEGCEATDEELWAYVRRFPAPRWYVRFVSAYMSAVTYDVARIVPGEPCPVPIGTVNEDTGERTYTAEEQKALDVMGGFRTKDGKFGTYMQDSTRQALVTGRWWSLGHPLMQQVLDENGDEIGEEPTDEIHYWSVYSDTVVTDERRKVDGRDHTVFTLDLKSHGGKQRTSEPPQTRAFRTYDPDPERPDHATSSMQAAVNHLRRICLLEAAKDAEAQSRAQKRGFFAVPSEWDMPAPYGWDDKINGPWNFNDWLAQAMTAPLKDPGSSDAGSPIMGTVPAEYADKAEFYDFWTTANEKLAEWIEQEHEYLSIAWDVPSEILSPDGATDLNHWNVWALQESTKRTTWEPLSELILGGITAGFFHPALRSEKLPDWHTYCLIPNLTKLMSMPAVRQDPGDVFDKGGLSLAEYVKESGYQTSQMPEGEEISRALAVRLATGAPSLAGALKDCIGLDCLDVNFLPGIQGGFSGTTTGEPSADQNEPPSITASAAPDPITAAKIVAAADSALYRHYTAAGAHLKNKLTEKAEKQRAQQQRLEHIAQALGPARVAELGVEFPASAYEHFHRQVTAWADAATADRCVAVVQAFVLATLHDPQIGVDVLPAEQVIEAMV